MTSLMILLSLFLVAGAAGQQTGAPTCALPAGTTDCSLITEGDATVAAHNIQKCLAVGGTLFDASPLEHAAVDGPASALHQMPGRWNFNKGFKEGPLDFRWADFTSLAQVAKSHTEGDYVVKVVTKGGTYNLYDFRPDGVGEDNGKTLVIFNTDEDVVLTATHDGRQFGPSVLAPFSQVTLTGEAGYIDGCLVAKTFVSNDLQAGQLQMHGNCYTGPLECGPIPTTTFTPPEDTTTVKPGGPGGFEWWHGLLIGLGAAAGIGAVVGGVVAGTKTTPAPGPCVPQTTMAPGNPCAVPAKQMWDAQNMSPYERGQAFGQSAFLPFVAFVAILFVVCAFVGISRIHKANKAKARNLSREPAQEEDDATSMLEEMDAREHLIA